MTKKITFITSIITALAMAVTVVSCTKDGDLLKEVISETPIQSFANDSSLNVALHEILSLSQEGRIAKDADRKFKSFGTIAQEFYETIDPDQFQSLEEIKAFVEKHSEYIQLIPEENGEYTLEVTSYNNPYRYLANKNREIKVGGSICKVAEESVIDAKTGLEVAFSPFKESVMERSITRKSNKVKETEVKETDDRIIVESSKQLIGSHFYATPTTGNNRLVVNFKNVILVPATNSFPILTYFRVQPYKKTLGVWFQCNRTLHMTIQFDGVLRIGFTDYPFSQDFTVTEGPQRTLGDGVYTAHQTVVLNAPWATSNLQITTNSYRFKGWSGSGNSREWVYKP